MFCEVYAVSAASLENEMLYDAAYKAVSQVRRQKADQFRNQSDRRLSLAAELLLLHALRTAGVEKPEFAIGKNGKPYLRNDSIGFNISHSGQWAVCAIADCEVGCDIEKIGSVNLKLADRFFTKSEVEEITLQRTPEQKLDVFFRFWTLKESFLKAVGLGLRQPMDTFEIVCGETITVSQSVNTHRYSFAEFSRIEGYRCAVCTEKACAAPQLHILSMEELLPEIRNLP